MTALPSAAPVSGDSEHRTPAAPRPFDELTDKGRTGRLRAMAREALRQYGIQDVALHLLKDSYNTIFRVDAPDGSRYVLRINRPGERDLTDIRSELHWLEALRRDTDLLVPLPLHTLDGSTVQTVEIPGVPEPRHCVLFHWIGGRHARRPSTRAIELLGESVARLESHADIFVPPPWFTRKRLDELWTFGTPEAIYSDRPHPLLTAERRTLIRHRAEQVREGLARLYADPTGLRFLHIDMHLGNVKFQRGRMAILDFDDSLWAFPIQDVAVSLFQLVLLPNGDVLSQAFKRGYARARPWPKEWDEEVDLYIDHRALDLTGYLSREGNERLARYMARVLDWLEPRLRHQLEDRQKT